MTHQKLSRRLALSIAGIGAIGLASACGSNATTTAGGGTTTSSTLTIGTLVGPQSFNPYKDEVGFAQQALEPVYDTLIRDNNGTLSPDIATSWSYPTPTSFTMKIRSGVKFSDGTPLDATAVKDDLEYAKTVNGPRTSLLRDITTITTPDATTVDLTLSGPNPSLPLTLSEVMGMLVSPKALRSPSLDQDPVGSGPYTLDMASTVANSRYTYVRNPGYWDPKAFPFDKIVVEVILDPTALVSALRAGQIDVAPGIPATASAARSAGVTVLSTPVDFRGLFLFDRAGKVSKPLSDVRVRQAMNYAIDRAAIVKGVANGYGQPTAQIFPPGTDGYVPALDNAYPYDPAKAKKLLAEAGYPNGFTLPVLSLSLLDNDLQAIAGYLSAVGIKIQIEDQQIANFFPALASQKYPAMMFTYGVQDTFQDAQALLLPSGSYNPFQTSDSQVNSLFTAGAAASSGATRQALFRQMSQLVVSQAWFLVAYRLDALYYVNTAKVSDVTATLHLVVPAIYGWRPAS
jgi:peptide/nickel transport system substrate-binding protein